MTSTLESANTDVSSKRRRIAAIVAAPVLTAMSVVAIQALVVSAMSHLP